MDDVVILDSVQPPAHSAVHGKVPRGLTAVPRSRLYAGRFGRMFRKLPPLQSWSEKEYKALAATMIDEELAADGDNATITAGYTYLGQFIDHDITFDPVSQLDRENDPDALHNFRTPRYDLDSLYGRGPQDAPFMYDVDGIRLFVETHSEGDDEDCPRLRTLAGKRSRAIIGDPRNDENIIINQLHLAFIKYHNAVARQLITEQAGQELTAEEAASQIPGHEREMLFEEARRLTCWHYQWIVIHDFLRQLVGEAVTNDIFKAESYVAFGLKDGQSKEGTIQKVALKFYNWKHQPFMPVEFSVAAFRFGHSMVRPVYRINQELEEKEIPDIVIFKTPFDEELAQRLGLKLNPLSMEGFKERPKAWEINWARFFKLDDTSALQQARKIDTQLALGLSRLPGEPPQPDLTALAARNLLRGDALQLPSGQSVAQAMGLPADLILNQSHMKRPNLERSLVEKLSEAAPLWYYILKEAEVLAEGQQLGPVGGRIVAEVLIGLLVGDPRSYFNNDPHWQPETRFGAVEVDGQIQFTMAELLRFAGVRTTETA